MIDLHSFDKTTFSTIPFLKRVEKPWGYELIFTSPDLSYTGKILHIQKGMKLSLQVHDKKEETQFLLHGSCKLHLDDENGTLQVIDMTPQQGYTIHIGQRHRLEAITDCDIVEVSMPEVGTTYRLEDDYNRNDETEELRKKERNTP